MGKGKSNVNVKMNVSSQVHLKAMWQICLKIELLLIKVGPVCKKKNGSGHKKMKRINHKLKRKANIYPIQNSSLGGQ